MEAPLESRSRLSWTHGGETGPSTVLILSIIFQLYLDNLPWQSGGEYLRFYQQSRAVVLAWRKVGIEPLFVFDGQFLSVTFC